MKKNNKDTNETTLRNLSFFKDRLAILLVEAIEDVSNRCCESVYTNGDYVLNISKTTSGIRMMCSTVKMNKTYSIVGISGKDHWRSAWAAYKILSANTNSYWYTSE